MATAKEQLMTAVHANGWTPDKTVTRLSRRGLGRDGEQVQNPYAFTKAAAHGGSWHIYLDYSVRSTYGREGNVLKAISVNYQAAGVTKDDRVRIGDLTNDKSRWRTSYLFRGLKGDDDDSVTTLRARAQMLLKDPDTAVWLSFQAEYDSVLKSQAQDRARKADRDARAVPLPITVDNDGYASGWKQVAGKVTNAGRALERADGKSDFPALVAELYNAVAALGEVLTPEARAAVAEAMGLVAS